MLGDLGDYMLLSFSVEGRGGRNPEKTMLSLIHRKIYFLSYHFQKRALSLSIPDKDSEKILPFFRSENGSD